MKKVPIFIFILLLSTISLLSRTITIIKSNCSSSGCYQMAEIHKDSGLFTDASSVLTCQGKGINKCEFMFDPKSNKDMIGPNGSNPDWQDLLKYAEEQIAMGALNGSYKKNVVLKNDFWYRKVSWVALGKNDCKITIDIQLVKSPN
jgi:hypothetical protein